jgi:NAD(P)-dependent dehydrogenase (short-subunit alcohol dehydrogenase family)
LAIHSGSGPRSGANLRVLITGAGSGIGYACARAFAEQGAELILSDIDAPALKRAASNFDALGRFCDVASEASVAVFTADVLKSYASLDVLINAAGRSYVRNLGTMRITRAFLPIMKSDGGAKHIVNIASMEPDPSRGCSFPYAASQEAFDRLSEALAENVRGTSIALTTVVPSVQAAGRKRSQSSTAVAPSGADPDEVAAAVVAAVHSSTSRVGEATVLTALLSRPDAAPASDASADSSRSRKSG